KAAGDARTCVPRPRARRLAEARLVDAVDNEQRRVLGRLGGVCDGADDGVGRMGKAHESAEGKDEMGHRATLAAMAARASSRLPWSGRPARVRAASRGQARPPAILPWSTLWPTTTGPSAMKSTLPSQVPHAGWQRGL